jgi:hypothetical protein
MMATAVALPPGVDALLQPLPQLEEHWGLLDDAELLAELQKFNDAIKELGQHMKDLGQFDPCPQSPLPAS